MSVSPSVAPDVLSDLSLFLERAAPGPFSYEACHHFAGSAHSGHVVLGFVVHGNEVGSLHAALELQERLLAKAPRGPVTLLVGNVDAVRAGVRYLEEDFNRVFAFDRPAESLERRRAERVRPILDAADYFLDFHQTGTPSESAFWTMPWTRDLGDWARALGAAPRGLTRRAEQAFSPGRLCLDEYVRNRSRLGITVELGQRGVDRAQAERCLTACLRLLELVDRIEERGEAIGTLALERPAVRWFETAHVLSSEAGKNRLRPGISNWMAVTKGENLGASDAPELPCPEDGFALFPAYAADPAKASPELVRIAREVADPETAFGS